ncbi:MAG TPA: adenylate/guanylate cyclase domain-containing protein [Ktedonobacteraceae bacterium]|nr:adenylate/guanylate cyclase domain-containing protein [Ktedonobacteraceae bacterium]
MTVLPDLALRVSKDLQSVGETLVRVSRSLHKHARDLERAVEGTYAGESGDPRVALLNDSLNVSRMADLELGRLNQSLQRILVMIQGQGQALKTGRAAGSNGDSFESEREALNTSIQVLKREHDELATLYEIARALNSTLEFDKVLLMVMDQVIQFVKAERGFLVLVNEESGELEFTIAREISADKKHLRTIGQNAFDLKISRSTVEKVMQTRQPVLAADAQSDDLLKAQHSIIAYGIRSIMCAPLIVRDKCIGAVYVDSRINTDLFGPRYRDLLLAFCHQAAIAIDNARLFADLTRSIRQINEDKQYMDNIFTSIANGVITTDSVGIITTFNNAAYNILKIHPGEAIGKHYRQVFARYPQLELVEVLEDAMRKHGHGTIVPTSLDCEVAGRTGEINLTYYVSALRDPQGTHIGMALVIDDRTELKRSQEEIRKINRIFGRYVHPKVVEQLISDPRALKLGGETKEISIVFADIRGYTRLSESMSPEQVMNLLNKYLEIMGKEIWDEGGTLTAFIGDALMAIFNAPLPQEDHALRAVRAAWKMRLAVQEYQRTQPQEQHISFGFGVNTGLAVVGNLGSEGRMQNYTAIGDAVNVASRLQSNASDNNILLNHSTFLHVRQHIIASQLPPLHVKNKSAPLDVWCLLGLVD